MSTHFTRDFLQVIRGPICNLEMLNLNILKRHPKDQLQLAGNMSADGDFDIDHRDIFQNLDVSLLELLHRRRVTERFLNASPDERIAILNEEMDTLGQEIDDTLIERHNLYTEQRGHVHNSVFRWVWIGIPLPVFRSRNFYRNYSMRRMLTVLAAFVTALWQRFVRMVLLVAFGFALFNYVPNLFRMVLVIGNQITFSENFLRDALTYIFRDNTAMMERHLLILKSNYDLSAGIAGDSSVFNTTYSLAYNITCRYLMSFFIDFGEDTAVYIDNKSLVFKFGDVINSCFPVLTSHPWYGTFVTVSVYMLYSVVGILICVNINWFYAANILNRILRYRRFYFSLAKIVWKSLFSEVL